ncbi:hypothetical protein ABW286_05010 [Erwinia papayae]|uniref:Uncharacterized protein n=1 Tax=Erwinia papayae TaxID=206499 RepID=A0ABV3MYA0_9GAMM
MKKSECSQKAKLFFAVERFPADNHHRPGIPEGRAPAPLAEEDFQLHEGPGRRAALFNGNIISVVYLRTIRLYPCTGIFIFSDIQYRLRLSTFLT